MLTYGYIRTETIKPNSVEHRFHLFVVQDILFQLMYQYISIRKTNIPRLNIYENFK
jgi:hypothetical protein